MALVLTSLWVVMVANTAVAHELQPGIADVTVDTDGVTVELRWIVETPLAGVDASVYRDSNDAPQAADYDRLRKLSPEALEAELRAEWPRLAATLIGEGAGEFSLETVSVEDTAEDLARETVLTLKAPLDEGAEAVSFGWAASNGPLVIRQERANSAPYAAMLDGGEISEALPVGGVFQESTGAAFVRFVIEGFEHIIPKGLDHILFVLGLFFFALAWSPLLWQVTAFTVAHTVTLAMATLGVITIPDEWMWLVEAIIALSITYVAVENILQPKLGWWRPAVVFAFGLLHGLGFASVLGDLGLAQGQFLVSLIAFNIGVEIGQLACILIAFAVIVIAVWAAGKARLNDEEAMVAEMPVMYRSVSIVGSLIIAAIGLYWFVERALL